MGLRLQDLARDAASLGDPREAVFEATPRPHGDARSTVPVVVVGAGPVGLALAIDLGQRGVPVVLLDDDDRLSTGSRAICFAQRTLQVLDRLGCGEAVARRGISWSVGQVFFRDQPVYRFDLLPEPGHERPAFVNVAQYEVEAAMVTRLARLPTVDLRWKHRVAGVAADAEGATLSIETPDGPYELRAEHVVACDGSRSAVRRALGLEATGRRFDDRFLIADVRMRHDGPAERWFWFEPPFHPGGSVLLHRQPDDVWRIDFQLGRDADPEEEKRPERILPRVRALLAHSAMKDAEVELVWASVYSFSCQRLARFRHGRVMFAGDSAHGVSPFGARGANSGVQDAENLAWKLAAVVRGEAPEALLETYAREREFAADENIRQSTRSTHFISPDGPASRRYRDAVLQLARTQPFARRLVNSGRLSTATALPASSLHTPDEPGDAFATTLSVGGVALDAPLVRADGSATWWLRELGAGFTLLVAAGEPSVDAQWPALRALGRDDAGPGGWRVVVVAVAGAGAVAGTSAPRASAGSAALRDADGLLTRRYDLRPGTAWLLRPDGHACARWRRPVVEAVEAARRRAMGLRAAA